jgi:hypothetical protein
MPPGQIAQPYELTKANGWGSVGGPNPLDRILRSN